MILADCCVSHSSQAANGWTTSNSEKPAGGGAWGEEGLVWVGSRWRVLGSPRLRQSIRGRQTPKRCTVYWGGRLRPAPCQEESTRESWSRETFQSVWSVGWFWWLSQGIVGWITNHVISLLLNEDITDPLHLMASRVIANSDNEPMTLMTIGRIWHEEHVKFYSVSRNDSC